MSLRRRLLIAILAVAAVLIITNTVLSTTFESYLLDRLDKQLVDVANRPFFRGRGPGPRIDEEQALSEYFIAVGEIGGSTLTPVSSVFADENEAPPRLERDDLLVRLRAQTTPEPFTRPALQGGGEWRLVAVANPQQGRFVVVGVSLGEINDTIGRVRVIQVGGSLAVLAALGLVSWWMLRLGVDPIEHMAGTADEIAAGDLSKRVEHPGPGTEAGRLGEAFNAMVARIEEAFTAREASEAQVRRFAADASHELRTPLTSIQGYAELFRAGGLRDEAEMADAMRRIEQEAQRMAALVDDLLLLARLDQKRPLERAPVRLDALAEDAVRDARAVEPDRDITLDAAPVEVTGDDMRLRQVVGNLLSNARVHTPGGTPVHVRVRSADGHAVIEVGDDGPGMEPAVAERVFERFYRADPARARSGGGTGLGLAIVAAVAEAHGGRARVESEVGRGTTFVVELPVDAPASS